MSGPTRTFDLYEVVKVPFPFTDREADKVRPALVLSSARYLNARIGASIMAMITSLNPARDLWPADIVIQNISSAGLPVPSIVRFKLFTLDHRLILGRLGTLSKEDRDQVQEKLRQVLAL